MAGVVHYGSICTQGLNCNTAMPPGNRELAEYAELTHDPLGLIHIDLLRRQPHRWKCLYLVFEADSRAGPASQCRQRRGVL